MHFIILVIIWASTLIVVFYFCLKYSYLRLETTNLVALLRLLFQTFCSINNLYLLMLRAFTINQQQTFISIYLKLPQWDRVLKERNEKQYLCYG